MFMPQVVTDFIKKNLVARIGPLLTLLIVCGVVFAVGFMIDRLYLKDNDNDFVYTVIVTAVTAAGYYVLAYLLSSMFPKLQQIKLWALVVLVAAVAFVGTLLDSVSTGLLINDDAIIEWALRIIMAGGIAYLFADMNRFIPGEGEPRLNRNMTLIVFIGMAAISASLWDLNLTFFDASTWLAGLLIGLIYGVVVSFLLFLALVESGGVVALEAEKPKAAAEKPKPAAAKPAPAVEEKPAPEPKAEAEKPKPAAKKPRAKKPKAAAEKPKAEAAEDKPEATEDKES
jgi:hypothetical protein